MTSFFGSEAVAAAYNSKHLNVPSGESSSVLSQGPSFMQITRGSGKTLVVRFRFGTGELSGTKNLFSCFADLGISNFGIWNIKVLVNASQSGNQPRIALQRRTHGVAGAPQIVWEPIIAENTVYELLMRTSGAGHYPRINGSAMSVYSGSPQTATGLGGDWLGDVGFPNTSASECLIGRNGGVEIDQIQMYDKLLSETESDALDGVNLDPRTLSTEPNLDYLLDFEDGTLNPVSGYGSDSFSIISGSSSSIITGGL